MIRATRYAPRGTVLSLAAMIAGGSLGLSSPQVLAQERQSLVVEEIIVTARKREESLQLTPISVSAFTEEQLQEIGLTELTSISAAVPNLQMQQDAGGGSAMIACMRGLCRSDTIITEDQMVGIYIDGFANTSAFGTFFDLVDIQQIEVLRGPQGTLFGKNTLGGAINIRTAPPSGEYGGRATLTAGNYNLYKGNVVVDVPVTDTLAAKVAFARTKRDGLVRNTLGSDLNDRDNRAARLALRWMPTDDFTADYVLDWYEARQARNPFQFTYVEPGLDLVFPGITGEASSNRLDRRAVIPGDDDVDQILHGLTLTWDLGQLGIFDDFSIKSLTGYKSAKNNTRGSTSRFWFLAGNIRQGVDSFSQEFQFSGSAFDGRLQMVSGLYYADVEGDFENRFHFGSANILTLQDLETQSESWAIFGEVSYDFSDRLTGSAGLRYTREKREASLNLLAPDGSLILPISQLAARDRFNTDNFSPRFSLQYRVSDEAMVYATLARGFKSGGLNGRASKPEDFAVYDDTVLDSLEVGVKSDLLDRRLRLNAAVFYQEVDDLQIQVNSLDPDTQIFLAQIRNAGEATMKGFELDVRFMATAGLELFGALGYLDAEYDKFLGFDPGTGAVVDVSNQREFQFAPEWTLNAGVRFEHYLDGAGTLVARIDYSYVDDQYFTVVPEDRIRGRSYDLINARVELRDIAGSDFSVALWGKNLADEKYRIGGFSIATFGIAPPDGLGTNLYGDRRTYGVDLTYRWGNAR